MTPPRRARLEAARRLRKELRVWFGTSWVDWRGWHMDFVMGSFGSVRRTGKVRPANWRTVLHIIRAAYPLEVEA